MKPKHLVLIALATTLVSATPHPADAGGSFGIAVSNHGVSIGFGGSNWGIWSTTWDAPQISVGFATALEGYGEWVWVDGLGRVWRPWVAASWRPYAHGRWVWTSLGWTWVAYEPWGWMPHHYGNWAYSTVGWVWTPGTTYHPGNVVWVGSGSYVGWYPCAPRGWSHAHRATHHAWNDGYRHGYGDGYQDGWRDARYATWVPRSRIMADNVSHHAVGHEVATHAVAHSRVTPMAAPPSKRAVERMVGRSVPETRVVERNSTVGGRNVRVVRPEVSGESVRRHAADTVKRALAPVARERALSTTSTSRDRNDVSSQRSRASAPPSAQSKRVQVGTGRSDSGAATRPRSIRTRSSAAADSTPKHRRIEAQRSRSSARTPHNTVQRPPVSGGNEFVSRSPARARQTSVSRSKSRTVTTSVVSPSRRAAAPPNRRAPLVSAPSTTQPESSATGRSDRSRKTRSKTSSGDAPRKHQQRKPR
ncbi:MAG: DUF6600 domain-containing protein [Thermoanaerobaculales bacterium]|jgi:hypothetical protein|nr:DUF6600 domain-containing protein [Thermoanaerobaculales bacterium]